MMRLSLLIFIGEYKAYHTKKGLGQNAPTEKSSLTLL
ncbi:Uncharacterised protein [Streptococcus acidominimus]|uniref:Uncharacterized protein n=1 Tax=Streptococcus acidominimus TaxID=1326 RepID=A0A380ICE6_STRAI|nr:Uncharacterised protein [Streptococcus acidominimus]